MATRSIEYVLAVKNAEQAIQKLQGFGDAGERAFRRLTKAATDADRIPGTVKATDAAVQSLRTSLEGLGGRAGVFGQIAQAAGPLGITAAAVAGVGVALTSLSIAAAESAGKLVDLSDLTDVATETLQAYRIAAAGVGLEQQQVDQAFQTFAKNVGDAELGTGKFAAKLKTLDPAFLGVIQHAGSTEEAFELTIAKIQELPSAAERAAVATAAFGAEGAKLALVSGTVDELVQKYTEAGAVIGDEVVRSADAAGDAFDEVNAILGAQVRGILTENAPAFLTLATTAVGAASSIVEAFRNVLEVLGLVNVGQEEQLRVAREQLNFQETARASAERGGAGETSLAAYDAQIAKQKEIIRQIEETKFARKEAANEEAKAAKDAIAAEQERIKALKDGEAAAKKAAKDAEAAGKKRAADEKQLADIRAGYERDVWTAGLDGIAKVDAERDVAYAKWAEQAKELGATEEEIAATNLAIWEQYERKRTEVMQEEAEKRAKEEERVTEKAAKEAEKAAKKQADEAEKAAEAMAKPFENAFEDVQDTIADVFVSVFEGGIDSAEDAGDAILSIFTRLAAQIATLMVIRPVLGGVTNLLGAGDILGSGGGLLGGSGGTSSFDIFGALKSVGGTLLDLTGLFTSGSATVSLGAGTLGELSSLGTFGGEFTGGTLATQFGLTESGVGSVLTGAGPGTTAAGSLGATAALAGYGAAIAAVVMGAVGVADINNNKALFTFEQAGKSMEKSMGIFSTILGPFASLGGTSLHQIFSNQIALTHGEGGNLNAGQVIQAAADPIGLILAALVHLPTKGTATRKSFEEFIEDKDVGAGFFARDSGTFHRGVGQKGTREILARDFPQDNPGDFVLAMRQYNAETAKAIGLTEEQIKQVTGLAAAFRAGLGAKAGNEEQRTLGIIADLLGSIQDEGASASETMEIVRQAILALGDPRQVFRTLNEFAQSPDNDIAAQDLTAAYEGLADALFGDLPGAVDASDLALEEFAKHGEVDFEKLAQRVADVTAAGLVLKNTLTDLGLAVAQNPDGFFADVFQGGTDGSVGPIKRIVDPAAIDEFKDQIYIAFRDATAQGLTEALIENTLKPTLLEPFIAKQRDIFERVQKGELTQDEGTALLAGTAADLQAQLNQLDPFLRAFIESLGLVGDAFNDLIQGSGDAADAIKGFDDSIQDQILALTDPDAAELQALEREQEARRKRAEELGADLVELDRLSALERTKLLERQGEEERRAREQQLEEERRAAEQRLEAFRRAQEQIQDLVTNLTASPSSPLPPQAAFAAAQAEFDRLARSGRSGNTEALEKLPQAAQNLLGLAETLYGSSSDFFAIFGPVLTQLEALTGAGLQPTIPPGDQAVVASVGASTTEIIDANATEQERLRQKLLDIYGAQTDGTTTISGDLKDILDALTPEVAGGVSEGSSLYTGTEIQNPGPSLYTGREAQGAPDWTPLQRTMVDVGAEIFRGNQANNERLDRTIRELVAIKGELAAMRQTPGYSRWELGR